MIHLLPSKIWKRYLTESGISCLKDSGDAGIKYKCRKIIWSLYREDMAVVRCGTNEHETRRKWAVFLMYSWRDYLKIVTNGGLLPINLRVDNFRMLVENVHGQNLFIFQTKQGRVQQDFIAIYQDCM